MSSDPKSVCCEGLTPCFGHGCSGDRVGPCTANLPSKGSPRRLLSQEGSQAAWRSGPRRVRRRIPYVVRALRWSPAEHQGCPPSTPRPSVPPLGALAARRLLPPPPSWPLGGETHVWRSRVRPGLAATGPAVVGGRDCLACLACFAGLRARTHLLLPASDFDDGGFNRSRQHLVD